MNSLTHWAIVANGLMAPTLAHAYIGPGAGLSAIGAVVALLGAVLLMILGFVWYPIKRLRKRYKHDAPSMEDDAPSMEDDAPSMEDDAPSMEDVPPTNSSADTPADSQFLQRGDKS